MIAVGRKRHTRYRLVISRAAKAWRTRIDNPEAEPYPLYILLPMNPIAVIPKCTVHVFWKAVEAGAREGAKEAGVEMIWKGSLKEDDPWATDPNRSTVRFGGSGRNVYFT